MRHAFCWIGLLALLVWVVPSAGQDVNKKDAKDTKKDAKDKKDDKGKTKGKDKEKDKEDEKALIPFGRPFYAQVNKVENGKIEVKFKVPFRNGNKIEFREQNVSYEIADNIICRIQQPPVAFTDKGEIKKYTKDELDQMKGPDKKLFGYTATIDQVKPQQNVQIFLGKMKGAQRNDPPLIRMINIGGNGNVVN